jgi:drug/metabolite transporter (DMT)-like permease
MHFNKQLVIGSLFVVLGEVFFVTMGMLVKTLGPEMPSHQMVFYRNLLAAIIIFPLLMRGSGLLEFKTQRLNMHLLRSTSGVLAMFCFFYALANIELADAMLLKLTGPLFIPIIAIFWIKEHVSLKTTCGILVGFAGVIIFLNPTGEIQLAAVVGLIGGALAAFAKVTIRKMSDTEPTTRIIFYFALFGALISAVPALSTELHIPTLRQWGYLILLGVVGTCGQFCLTQAYRLAPASHVGPFTYSSLLWASLAGWLFWAEIPSTQTLIGAGLIMTAGFILIYNKGSAKS